MVLSFLRPSLRVALLFLFALLVTSLSACSSEKKKEAAKPQDLPVTAVKAVSRDIVITRDFIGQTQATKTVEIRAKVDGYLKERLFTEGSMVEKGQKLFRIDPEPFQESLNEAQAQLHREQAGLAKAQVDYKRFKALLDQDAISHEEYDVKATALKELQATVQGYESAVQNAKLDLGYTLIKAPMRGLIGKTEINIGALVSKQQTVLATVSDMDPIYVNFSISERDYLLARRYGLTNSTDGTDALERGLRLLLSDDDEYQYKGRIDMIDPTVDPKTGTLGVRCVFNNPDRLLRPGQYAKIRADIGKLKNAVVVPSRALIDTQGIKSLLVVETNGTVANVPVKVQRVINNIAVIEDGVKAGTVVVSEGVRRVRPGAHAKVTLQPFNGEVADGSDTNTEKEQN